MSGINLQPEEVDPKRLNSAIRELNQGRSDAIGTVTLRASQTTTVVTKAISRGAVNIGLQSKVSLIPRTATAAASIASVFISAVGLGTFTITHNSTAATDRTFDWSAQG